MAEFADIDFVFDATSAGAHIKKRCRAARGEAGIRVIDLTPAAVARTAYRWSTSRPISPSGQRQYGDGGGQATIPMVAAVPRVAKAHTRRSWPRLPANPPDQARGPHDRKLPKPPQAIEKVGGAGRAKGLRYEPGGPPLMRDTAYVLSELASQEAIAASIAEMAAAVQAYVPGYRLKQQVQFEVIPEDSRSTCPASAVFRLGKLRIYLEVGGAAQPSASVRGQPRYYDLGGAGDGGANGWGNEQRGGATA
ncbi:hypothetical protein LNP25_26890 [Klebsiella variicola subsp. variicola]|nr:hypothetical protein [Klebsiella variicola subsp. variicola]